MFSNLEWFLISLIFIWIGFVRSGFGFGGAAFGLPLLLLIYPQPLFWLPIIGIHVLFFASFTLRNTLHQVHWRYLIFSLKWIVPSAILGLTGLINFTDEVLLYLVYSITLFYGGIWMFNYQIKSKSIWFDNMLLLLGGYVAGTSLTGAPILAAVYMRYIEKIKLRSSFFALWFILVSMKMLVFISFDVKIEWQVSLLLIPVAAIGDRLGFVLHRFMLKNKTRFSQIIGIVLVLISLFGMTKYTINLLYF